MPNGRLITGLSMAGLTLAACSTDGASTYALTFVVGTGATPVALAAQDGDGAWQPVALDANGVATFEVTAGFHGWASRCDPSPRIRIGVRYDAGAPAAAIAPCGTPIPVSRLRGHVTPGAARVFAGGAGEPAPTAADGSYELAIVPGNHDVVVLEASGPRALIHRDLVFTADTTLDLDLATGFDRVLAPASVNGAGAETVTLLSELHTRDGHGTFVPMDGTTDAMWVVPAAARAATDRMVAAAEIDAGETTRLVQQLVPDATIPPLTFAARPTLSADHVGATWSGTPDAIFATLETTTTPLTVMQVAVTPAWQAAHDGVGTVPWIDPSVSGGTPFATGTAMKWGISVETGDRAGELALDSQSGTLTW